MGSTLSEPCIYDKLSESIDILRQSGYRYGMSEREIEKFIKQVLETNEPRRDPPQFPLLRATVKVVVAVGVLLIAVLAFMYPQSLPQAGSFSTGQNWTSPLSHIRLLSLPIAKKYNLHSFHTWWGVGGVKHTLLNCSACAGVSAVLELNTLHTESLHTHTQPVLLKAGESLQLGREHLEKLYSAMSESVLVLLEEEEQVVSLEARFPQSPANFSLLWRFDTGSREEMLQHLFPSVEHCPLLERAATTLRRCRVSHSLGSQSRGERVSGWLLVGDGSPTVRVLPLHRCQTHCSSFNLWLSPGDLVYADPRFWQLELFPGQGENIMCDGSAL
ncbi:bombesin receptor-activated protein C6orf89 homolog [Hoplias malabaricus]|uniref:bombesin receptor-activated protein C6orf89 homolog n=1 Tax=Hoplias malabaricus TaxID=27720 RepID=UPI0034634B04